MSHIETPRFPDDIAFGASSSPGYKNLVSIQAGGHRTVEVKWTYPLHIYNISHGINTKDKYETVLDWFHATYGNRHTFRFKDWMDFKSCHTGSTYAYDDCVIGTGDGADTTFQIYKTYTKGSLITSRKITKLVATKLAVGVNGTEKTEGADFTVDDDTGIITFGVAPTVGHSITAGFEYDVPVSFLDERWEVTLETVLAANAPIMLAEVRI